MVKALILVTLLACSVPGVSQSSSKLKRTSPANTFVPDQIRKFNIPDGTIVNVLGIGPVFQDGIDGAPGFIAFSESMDDFNRNDQANDIGNLLCFARPSVYYTARADYGHNSFLLLHGKLKRHGKFIAIENCRLIDPHDE